METLKLVLKKKWYDLIEKGIKREEYREIKDYYTQRLFFTGFSVCVRKYDYVTFYLGYQKNRPSMTFRIKLIGIGEGKPEWGAEKGKLYYIIVLDTRVC